MAIAVSPGDIAPLVLQFIDANSGMPADPVSVQLDITYGSVVGSVPDTAGPFTYSGASSPAPGQVWRSGTGAYNYAWQVPPGTPSGVYVANWTCVYGGSSWPGTEDFVVTGGTIALPFSSGDTGYWTGSLAYGGNTVEFGQVDANGICWLWQKLDGWDGPDVSGALIQRSGDHGAWASPQYFAPRNMTLTVTASAPTQALRDTARALLSQVVPVSDLALLTCNEPIPKTALVRRSGKLTEAYPTLCDVTFTIGLVAPDPRKYSAVTSAVTVAAAPTGDTGTVFPVTFPLTWPAAVPAGEVAVTNNGNFETRPVITLAGPVASPVLTNLTTGQAVSWTGLTIPAGDSLTVDFLARQATDTNGQYWPADIASSWWQVPPGITQIQLGGGASTGASFSVIWNDAFI